jgi:hypothetical protein
MVGKPEGKKQFGRPRRRWKDNIRMYLKETEWEEVDWIQLALNRDRWRDLVNTVMNLRVPPTLTFSDTLFYPQSVFMCSIRLSE